MNLAKSELKLALTKEIGATIEARESAALAEMHRCEGALGGLKQAIECLHQHKKYYAKDLEEAKIEKPICDAMIKAIDHCVGILTNLGDKAQATKIAKHGEHTGVKAILDYVEKMHNDERNRLAGVLQAIDDGKITKEDIGRSVDGSTNLRVVDGRPTNGAAADLQARRAAAKQAKDGEGATAETVEAAADSETTEVKAADTTVDTPAQEPKKKGYTSLKKGLRGGQAK